LLGVSRPVKKYRFEEELEGTLQKWKKEETRQRQQGIVHKVSRTIRRQRTMGLFYYPYGIPI
jgi:hypothetical protein